MHNSPLRHIREKILGLRQFEMARVVDASQSTVSRWERGELQPTLQQMAAIRAEATSRGIKWRDQWFYEIPKPNRAQAKRRA